MGYFWSTHTGRRFSESSVTVLIGICPRCGLLFSHIHDGDGEQYLCHKADALHTFTAEKMKP